MSTPLNLVEKPFMLLCFVEFSAAVVLKAPWNDGLMPAAVSQAGGASPCSCPLAPPFMTGGCQRSIDSPQAPVELDGVEAGVETGVAVAAAAGAQVTVLCLPLIVP